MLEMLENAFRLILILLTGYGFISLLRLINKQLPGVKYEDYLREVQKNEKELVRGMYRFLELKPEYREELESHALLIKSRRNYIKEREYRGQKNLPQMPDFQFDRNKFPSGLEHGDPFEYDYLLRKWRKEIGELRIGEHGGKLLRGGKFYIASREISDEIFPTQMEETLALLIRMKDI